MDKSDRYGKAIADTIARIRRENLEPTEALLKTAATEKLSRPEVEYVAAHINSSRALVHMYKHNGAERASTYPIADPEVVMNLLNQHKAEASADLARVFSQKEPRTISVPKPEPLKKTAAAEAVVAATAKMSPIREWRMIIDESEAVQKQAQRLHKAFNDDSKELLQKCAGVVNDICSQLKRMPERERTRYARRVVNGYPDTGAKIVETVFHSAGIDSDVPPRTSSETVFPAETLYTNTAKFRDLSHRIVLARANADTVKHTAGGFMEDFLANSAALGAAHKWLPSSGLTAEMDVASEAADLKRMESEKGLVDMSPIAAARISGLKTRRVFMDAVLNDPALRGYKLSQLSRAFNDAVQTDPDIIRSPPRLRAGMMQMLQSSVLDPFMLSQMVDTGKKQQAIFKGVAERRENVAKAVKGVAEKAAGYVGDLKTEMAKAGEDQIRMNKDEAKEYRGNIAKDWSNFKTSMKSVKNEYDRRKLVELVPRRVDARLSVYSAEELAELAAKGGYSGVQEMRNDMIRVAQAPGSKSVFTPGFATDVVEKEMEVLDRRHEEEAKAQAAAQKQAADEAAQALAYTRQQEDNIAKSMLGKPTEAREMAIQRMEQQMGVNFAELSARGLSTLATPADRLQYAEAVDLIRNYENRILGDNTSGNEREGAADVVSFAKTDPVMSSAISGSEPYYLTSLLDVEDDIVRGHIPDPVKKNVAQDLVDGYSKAKVAYFSQTLSDGIRRGSDVIPSQHLIDIAQASGRTPEDVVQVLALAQAPKEVVDRIAPQWQTDMQDVQNALQLLSPDHAKSAQTIELAAYKANAQSKKTSPYLYRTF